MDKQSNQHEALAKQYREKTLNGLLESQKYSEISKSQKQKFTDELFPPTESSIFSGKTDFSAQRESTDRLATSKNKFFSVSKPPSKYVWLRLSEVYKQGELNILKIPKEIRDYPDILTEDVIQGELGDCYFLSAISALAENPDRIKSLFPVLTLSNSGALVAKIYIHGNPTEVVVDDYFPFIEGSSPQNATPAFVGLNKNSKNIWPMILEKVWAKLNLSYENIIAGNSAEAFEFLTPAPIETYYHDVHEDILYDVLKSADQKDYIICADVTLTENTNIEYLTKLGLISNHAYTVIDLAEVMDPQRKIPVRLLKIRNPWGTNEWVGDWSDKSPKWTPELKEQLDFKDEDDGIFWMAYEDFCKFYTSTHICMVKNNYNLCYDKFNYDKNVAFNLVQVDIPKDTSGFFIINQRNTRIYRNAKALNDFENLFCSMIVFKEVSEGEYVNIGGDSGRQNRLYVECEEMTKGRYYIAVSFPLNHHDQIADYDFLKTKTAVTDDVFTYRVGVYSPLNKLEIVDIQGDEEMNKVGDFLKDVIFHCATNNEENLHYFVDEGEKESWRSISFEKDGSAYGYIAYENNSDAIINEEFTFKEFFNLNLIPIEDIKGKEVEFDENLIEDTQMREIISRLRREYYYKSNFMVTSKPKQVSEKTPLIIQASIAPHSRFIILLEKTEEDASIDLESKISLVYPTFAILNETNFPPKKTKIKYNDQYVDIYESIVEHSSGVLFVYKNKTQNLKFGCHAIFPELDNLSIAVRPEDNIKSLELDYTSVDPTQSEKNLKNPQKEVAFSIEPGEFNFFELRSDDAKKSFSYSSEMNYQVNLSRNKIKQRYLMK